MRTFTRETTPLADLSARTSQSLSIPAPSETPPGRPLLLRGRPSVFVFVAILAGWELLAPPLVKISALVGSVTGSMNAAAMRGATESKAAMDGAIAAAVEKAKLEEQLRYQPLLGALDTAFKNCQAQTQALAQAQSQLIGQRAALSSRGVGARMSSGGSWESLGSMLNGLSPGSGDGLTEWGRKERDAAMSEFEKQAFAAAPNITLQDGICGDDPSTLLQNIGQATTSKVPD